MTLGYSCDAAECDELQDAAFATVTLDLDSLPTAQGLTIALNLHQQGVIELDDLVYMNAMQTLRGNASFEYDLPRTELHLCPDHALTALSSIGVVQLEEEESEDEIQSTLDAEEQQA